MNIKTMRIIDKLLRERDAELKTVWEDENRKLEELREKRDAAEDEAYGSEDEAVFNQERRVSRAWERLKRIVDALRDWESADWK